LTAIKITTLFISGTTGVESLAGIVAGWRACGRLPP
jgi:hypothetical protein